MGETAESVIQPQHLEVTLARCDKDIERALRLRYRVFVEEEKNFQMRNGSGIETDAYDAYCDHLIVKDLESGDVVGTYRLLPGTRAVHHIGFYSETEFDLSGFRAYKPRALELGRSCVAPEYRSGRAIQLLWEGIAQYINEWNYNYLIGCASVRFKHAEDLPQVYTLLRRKAIITDRYGVAPLATHRIEGLKQVELPEIEKDVFRKLPPLMKGYQWLGAEIGGDPAYDPIFDSVDFFIVLHKENMTRRYRRRFISN